MTERAQNADFRSFRTPSPGNSSIWSAQGTAENHRFSQKTEDFLSRASAERIWGDFLILVWRISGNVPANLSANFESEF